MNIGMDFDDTYTRDPKAWNDFIRSFRSRGHKVYIVTWRFESESNDLYLNLGNFVDGIYPTGRLAKEKFMYSKGIRIDVWIDDNPSAILNTMEGFN